MGLEYLKYDYPGLLHERLPSGASRWRVRVAGNKSRRIRIHCGPEHEKFQEQYLTARAGIQPGQINDQRQDRDAGIRGSVGWLVLKYLAYFEKEVSDGRKSPKTLKKKRNLFRHLAPHAEKTLNIPRHKIIEIQDQLSGTPAQADALIEAMSVMFQWGIKRNHATCNPAQGIDRIYKKGKGATPWSAQDLKQYLSHHKIGSKAHAAVQVLIWTGCRIEDLTVLGRGHECVVDGVEAIRFQPLKKGSSEVCIPHMPQMKAATRALKIQGQTYLLGRGGKPYASGDSMSATFKQWCIDAGLPDKSAHGIRKALAELLAEMGCNQYEIMAILGHKEARTSEVYTRFVDRWRLASQAMERIKVSHAWS